MREARKPSVGKLLRVLVAGGVALAGTAGPLAAAAEEAPKKADKATTEKAGATQKPADAEAARKKEAGTGKDQGKEKEKKAEEAGGVKGW
jgi:hypothetical protein